MDFNAWCAANEFDPATLTPAQKAKLQAQWRAEQNPAPKPDPEPKPKPAPDAKPAADGGFDAQMEAIDREAERINTIRTLAVKAMEDNVGHPDKVKQLRTMCDAAVADQKTTVDKFRWALIQASDRFAGPLMYAPSQPQVTDEVVEAAVCVAHRLPGVEKKFSDRTLEAAHKQFGRGVSLKRLLMMGAKANGFRGDDGDYYGVCRAAMGPGRGDDYRGGFGPVASVGVSTGVQVPGILANTANKFLAASFMNVEQAWRGIARIRGVNDFKQVTTYRMSGNNTFLRVPPGGEIKHGSLAETSYTNQAKTYGRLLGISREDYINDDLGAFVSVTQELGRGAADALNNIFWATFLDDAAFFPVDKSLGNYDDGSTDSVLSLAGLDNAESIFGVQTKPDGSPLGATAKILLVPTALKNAALTFMSSQDLVVGTTAATGVNKNIFAGRYEVVSSAYLSRTSINDENGVPQTVTGSSTAWYLLADPSDIPAIEVVFLFGKDAPTVETDQFEFDRLGLATRAYFDFGVSRQEYRAGVKMKGAA